MEEYMNLFKEYIREDRHTYTKTMFKIAGTIYRGVNNNRFTIDDALRTLQKLGGVSNANN